MKLSLLGLLYIVYTIHRCKLWVFDRHLIKIFLNGINARKGHVLTVKFTEYLLIFTIMTFNTCTTHVIWTFMEVQGAQKFKKKVC